MLRSESDLMINLQLTFVLQVFLLNMIHFEKKDKNIEIRYKRVVLLLVAACLLITQYWKTTMVPIKEWYANTWNIMLMHNMPAIVE